MTIIELNSVHAARPAEPPINKTFSSQPWLDSSPLHNRQLITNQLLLSQFYKKTMMIFTDWLTDWLCWRRMRWWRCWSKQSGQSRFGLHRQVGSEVSIMWFEENQRVRLCCNRGYVRLCCILTPPPDSTVSKEIQRNIRTSKFLFCVTASQAPSRNPQDLVGRKV